MIIKYHISVAVYIDYIHTHLTITFELSRVESPQIVQ